MKIVYLKVLRKMNIKRDYCIKLLKKLYVTADRGE